MSYSSPSAEHSSAEALGNPCAGGTPRETLHPVLLLVLDQFDAAGFTTTVPFIVLPCILQWYWNSPSLSNFTGIELSPGLISPVSKVLPLSSEVAVWFEKALLVQTIESPTEAFTILGS